MEEKKELKMIYEDSTQRLLIDFTNNPEKYKQILLAKARWWNISVQVEISKWRVENLLSTHLFVIN